MRIETILELASTAIKLLTTASDIRRKFFDYVLCLVLVLVGGGFLIAGAGFLIWALYDGLAVTMASANSARVILCLCSFVASGILIWVAKKTIT